MAYNVLSGTVIAAQEYTPSTLVVGNIVSGNLSTSDGANVINVPRVSNATNNAILTNVGGDANSITCESNLTFDGSTLSLTGDLTASVGVSASYFEGDGSRLTGISAGGGGGGGSASAGPAYSLQFVTASGRSGTTGSVKLLYSSNNLTFTGSLRVSGTTYLDGNLVPTLGSTHDLGTSANPWGSLYVDAGTIYMGSDALTVADNNLKFGSGSTTKGFDVGFMNFKNNGIFMDPGFLFKLRAYQIQMFGGIGYVRRVVADDYTIQEIDYLVGIQSDTLTASVTLTLPSADGVLNGQTYAIKDEGGNASTYPVIIRTQGSDTIDRQTSIVLESPYAAIQLYCNGLNKYFVY